MRRRLVRTLLAVATVMVVWLVVSPASAFTNRAPVCDPRGAVGFAPPPQIQNTETSLDIAYDCGVDVDIFDVRNAVPTKGSTPLDFSSAQEPAAATAVVLLDLVFIERLPARIETEGRPSPGVRSSLDRPPRL